MKPVREERRSRLVLWRLLVALVGVVVVAAAAGCGRETGPSESGGAVQQEQKGRVDRDSDEAAETGAPAWQSSGRPALVDLGAGKCVPCKMMAPILDEMRGTFAGQLDVVFIDVWKDPAPGRQYGVKVIPTQIFFDEDGNELFRHQGFFSREDILAKWKELGYEFEE